LATMKLNSITAFARKLLNSTHQLAMGPNTYKSVFAQVLEGTFRRDYLTLYTMLYLIEHSEPGQRRAFGDCCLDLSRKVLEDLVSLEYMLLKGKESHAKKFFDYYNIEAKRDSDFLEAAGAPIDRKRKILIEKNYNRVKRDFFDSGARSRQRAWSDLTEFLMAQNKIDQQTKQQIEDEFNRRYPNVNEQPRRAWAGLDNEAMIETLVQNSVISPAEQKILIQTYIQGNNKNHFSPTDIRAFLRNDPHNIVSDSDLALSLVSTTTAVTRIARIFTDEFDIPEDTKQAVEEIWQTIFAARLSEEE
jgi:hypothetical protein